MSSCKNGQLRIALINGIFLLVGTISGGVISNWNEIFGTTITANYAGYKPTGDFATEARYFMDVAGTRRDFKILLEKRTKNVEALVKVLSKQLGREEADQLDKIPRVVREEQITPQEMIDAILPVYQEYYTVAEMQELNKFFSTDVMRALTAKGPVVWEELFLAIQNLEKLYIERYSKRLITEFPDNPEIQKVANALLKTISKPE